MLFDDMGIVLIGRNEGDRLRRCLESVIDQVPHIVYVDSDSTDGSLELAKRYNVDVIELDKSKPFASPRSRNAGFFHLVETYPEIKYVQFVDGDCVLDRDWLAKARATLDHHPQVAVVCGRRREMFPKASIYNQVFDVEWDTPIGEARSCGGDALMRPEAIVQVNGYNPTLIGGGEPEMCVRLRQRGWKILRIDAEMTLHDADTHEFSRWWRRIRRCGHAYAEGAWLHGAPPEYHWVKQTLSNWFWGLGFPAFVLLTAWPTHGWSLFLLLGYGLLIFRAFLRERKRLSNRLALTYSAFCVLTKFPMMMGQAQFMWNKLRGRKTRLVEYKRFAQVK